MRREQNRFISGSTLNVISEIWKMHGSVGWDNIKIATVSCDGFKKWIPSLRALVERDSITEKSRECGQINLAISVHLSYE